MEGNEMMVYEVMRLRIEYMIIMGKRKNQLKNLLLYQRMIYVCGYFFIINILMDIFIEKDILEKFECFDIYR